MARLTMALLALIAAAPIGCGGENVPPPPAEASSAHASSVQAPSRCPALSSAPGQPSIRQIDTGSLIGLGERAATELARSFGCQMQVVSRDGQRFATTANYLPERIRVTTRNGVVVAVDGVG